MDKIDMRVLQLITSLSNGGAENVLFNIINNKSNQNIEYKILVLKHAKTEQILINKLEQNFIDYKILDIVKNPFKTIKYLCKEIKDADVLSCWMYQSNLVGCVLNKFYKKKIVLNIRHSNIDKDKNSKSMLLSNYYCMRRSKKVDKILYNGETAKKVHENYGYDKTKSQVINNGCDTELFSNINRDKNAFCNELGITNDKKIVLSVGRCNVLKDIPNFINAIAQNKDKHNIIGVMCGNNLDEKNIELVKLITDKGLEINKDIILLGVRTDINKIMASSDIYVMHSLSEAFSNTLIQAMSCGIPVISTDAGVSYDVMVNKNLVSKVEDYSGLANNLDKVLSMTAEKIEQESFNNRKKIIANFDIKNIVKQYEKIYMEI